MPRTGMAFLLTSGLPAGKAPPSDVLGLRCFTWFHSQAANTLIALGFLIYANWQESQATKGERRWYVGSGSAAFATSAPQQAPSSDAAPVHPGPLHQYLRHSGGRLSHESKLGEGLVSHYGASCFGGSDAPCLFVVFGVTGDLVRRKLLPALYRISPSEPRHQDA
jgi:hypothetical protein